MKSTHDLSTLDWTLSGWIPYLWEFRITSNTDLGHNYDVCVPAKVPGSVQYALLQAGELPDWNVGLNYKQCEWVENRHWIYEVKLPDQWFKQGKTYRLRCMGLDYAGRVFLNGGVVGEFKNTHIPYI